MRTTRAFRTRVILLSDIYSNQSFSRGCVFIMCLDVFLRVDGQPRSSLSPRDCLIRAKLKPWLNK